jgi:hypothetical protein
MFVIPFINIEIPKKTALRQNLPVYDAWRINRRERKNSQTGVREYQERLPDNECGIC